MFSGAGGVAEEKLTTLLKNSKEPEKSITESDNSNKYGITRGAAYWKKGGDGND